MRGFLGLGLVALLIAGCGSAEPAKDNGSGSATGKGSAPWQDETRPAAAAAKLGGANTACPLPVAVDLPDKWRPVRIEAGDFHQGGLDALCEIDAKPAGAVGFIRVFVGSATEPRKALESYLADQRTAHDVQYRDTGVGQGAGAEATWVDDETGRKRAFAVSTPLKTIVFSVGGIDEDEYQKMLPAFLLAKQSLAPIER